MLADLDLLLTAVAERRLGGLFPKLPHQPEREVALRFLPKALRGGEQIVCDKGHAGREFAEKVEARWAIPPDSQQATTLLDHPDVLLDLGGFSIPPSRMLSFAGCVMRLQQA